jgi:hypothetical protein
MGEAKHGGLKNLRRSKVAGHRTFRVPGGMKEALKFVRIQPAWRY